MEDVVEQQNDPDTLKTACRWAALLFLYVAYRLWNEGLAYTDRFRADGRVIIVTGANAGVGRQTALGLARRGAHVYLACRNEQRGLAARDDIVQRTGNPNVHYMHLDLASLQSVHRFADEFLKREHRLDVLVNNAAVMHTNAAQRSADGLEMNMAVNHYGHFALTALLMGRLRESAPSRIVNVTSDGHGWVGLNEEDGESDHEGGAMRRYMQSKLANVLFTKELGRRLDVSLGVTVNCVHPGWNMSRLTKDLGAVSVVLNRSICRAIALLFFKTTESAAQTCLYAALDVNLLNFRGEYFAEKWFSRSAKNADDQRQATLLWERSERLTGVKFDIKI